MSNEKMMPQTTKLHIGCGTVYLDGWINIDNNSDRNIEKLDMNVDIINGLPFDDNTVDFIFNEHFLEHLTYDEALKTIKEFMRVLKPGGVLRAAMPDITRSIQIYNDENWKKNNAEYFEKYGLTGIKTRAENLNIDFRAWGHKHLYDYEELERLLKDAGCENIRRRFIHESMYETLRNLETRKESTLIAEVKKGRSPAPLLTVVCITYNHEAFIRDALESFIAQETNFPFEVIISDDASTDSTPEILREYEKKHGNIIKVIYRKTNLGAMGNYVNTLFEARSKYVVYNEGDDYFTDTHKLQKQVDFLEAHPEYSMCFHPVIVRYQDDSKPDEMFPSAEFRFNKEEFSLEDILKYNFMQTNSVMYRWRFVDENILETFPSYILPGDYYLHLLHAQKGNIGFLDGVMAVYRRHPGGIWWCSQWLAVLYTKYCVEMFNFYSEVYKNIAENPEAYYTNTLIPMFDTAAQECDDFGKLTDLFARHPRFAAIRYKELSNLVNTLTHSVSYRVSQKLMSNRVVRIIYLICKKVFKTIRKVGFALQPKSRFSKSA